MIDIKTPQWCDLKCEYASFPDEKAVDGSGSCRTFSALYCSILERYVQKNAPCTVKKTNLGSK
ncbi:hypothetical protein ACFL5P_00875 [candidate division KSB1 bacterium]